MLLKQRFKQLRNLPTTLVALELHQRFFRMIVHGSDAGISVGLSLPHIRRVVKA
jgi:hypothetical protein